MTANKPSISQERADLIDTLREHRSLLERTVQGLNDEQAAARTTVSELCLGGIIKHVAAVEENWARFIVHGSGDTAPPDQTAMEAHAGTFQMAPGDSLAALLHRFHEVASRTDELVATYPSLDQGHHLPPAPWFPPGTAWSARRSIAHIIAETAQHAGHADIIREALDGQKSMG